MTTTTYNSSLHDTRKFLYRHGDVNNNAFEDRHMPRRQSVLVVFK